MPQTLSKVWRESLGPMAEQIHSDFLHVLGNLTLVTSEWNSELSNSPFETKREKLASHALRLNSTYFGQELERWGREEIQARGEALAAVVLELWPTLLDNDEESDELLQPGRRYAVSEFHMAAAERIASKLGAPFQRLTECRYETPDGTHRLVGMCSKPYKRGGGATHYWFGLKVAQRGFLLHSGKSWLALECESPSNLFVFPYAEFEAVLPLLNETKNFHWHISIRVDEGRFRLLLPVEREMKDLEPYRV